MRNTALISYRGFKSGSLKQCNSFAYGIKNLPREDISEVINYEFQKNFIEDQKQRYMSIAKEKGEDKFLGTKKIFKQFHTKASKLRQVEIEKKMIDFQKKVLIN
jgi:hypothetical protein